MALVKLPSVLVDGIAEDFLNAVAATMLSANAEPFSITDGASLELEIDGGAPQLIAFNDVDFDDLDAATAAEVVAVINAGVVGAIAEIDDGRIRVSTLTAGSGGSVEITVEPSESSGPDPSFDFPSGTVVGADAAVQTLLVNRIPEPDESGVALASTIELEVYRAGAAAPASNTIDVEVGGILVLTAGSALASWAVAFSTPDASTLRIVLTPPVAFASDVEVDVHVESAAVGLSESYSFRTLDAVRPMALAAVGRTKRSVRVTFSEAVQQVDPAAVGDALNPANYMIERASRPAVAVFVESVVSVSTTEVDLLADIELSFGASYELVVVNVLDVAGNMIAAAPDNVVAFTGFVPPFPDGRRFMLIDFLPAMNLSEDVTGDLRMFLAVVQEVTNVLVCDIDEWARILDPDRAPEAFVDAMLADLGSPFTFDLSEIDKRRLLRILVRLYQLKGTQWGVIDAIGFFLGIAVTVEIYTGTGWELTEDDDEFGDELSDLDADSPDDPMLGPGRAELYSFRVVSPVDLTDAQRDQIRILANYMRVSHEHYLGTREPTPKEVLDHVVLGISELGDAGDAGEFILH